MRFAVLLLLLGFGTAIPQSTNKPTPPVELEARLEGDPAGTFTIIVRTKSTIDGDVRAEVLLPEGVIHLEGARSRSGREVGLRLTARSPDASRREIFVRASVTHGGARMARVVCLVLNDSPIAKRGFPRRNSRGEKIIEFTR